jgi:hypothetical protein
MGVTIAGPVSIHRRDRPGVVARPRPAAVGDKLPYGDDVRRSQPGNGGPLEWVGGHRAAERQDGHDEQGSNDRAGGPGRRDRAEVGHLGEPGLAGPLPLEPRGPQLAHLVGRRRPQPAGRPRPVQGPGEPVPGRVPPDILPVLDRLPQPLQHPALDPLQAGVDPLPALEPQLDGLVLDLRVVRPHEPVQVGLGLVARLLEPAEAGGRVQDVPLGRVPAGPLLDGGGPAVDVLGDVPPGPADGPHLGGDGQQAVQVAAHGGLLPRTAGEGSEDHANADGFHPGGIERHRGRMAN